MQKVLDFQLIKDTIILYSTLVVQNRFPSELFYFIVNTYNNYNLPNSFKNKTAFL